MISQPSSGRLDAVCGDMIAADHHADQAHAFLDQVDRGPVQLESIIAALVALEDEAAAFTLQQPRLIDLAAGQSVASIERAA